MKPNLDASKVDNSLIFIFLFIEEIKQKKKQLVVKLNDYISLFPHLKSTPDIGPLFTEGLKSLSKQECLEKTDTTEVFYPYLKKLKINHQEKGILTSAEVEMSEKIFFHSELKGTLMNVEDLIEYWLNEKKVMEPKVKNLSDWHKISFFLFLLLSKNYLNQKIFDKNSLEFSIQLRKNSDIVDISQKNSSIFSSSLPHYSCTSDMKELVFVVKSFLRFMRQRQKILHYEITPSNEDLIVEVFVGKTKIILLLAEFLDKNYSSDLFLFL